MTDRIVPVGEDTSFDIAKGEAQTQIGNVALANGNMLTLWQGASDSENAPSFYVQIFNSAGTEIGDLTAIGTTDVELIASPDGLHSVLAWQDEAQATVYVRTIDGDGSLAENALTIEQKRYDSIVLQDDGSFVLIQTLGDETYAQIYNADGKPDGAERLLFTMSAHSDDGWNSYFSDVYAGIAISGGGFAIPVSNTTFGHSYDAGASGLRWYSADGQFITYSALGSNWGERAPSYVETFTLSEGITLVAWDDGNDSNFGSQFAARLFDAEGTPVSNEFEISGSIEVAPVSSDVFIIIWVAKGQDGSGDGVFGQLYSWEGAALADPFQINSDETTEIKDIEVLILADGMPLVTWRAVSADPSASGVYGKNLTFKAEPTGFIDTSGIVQIGSTLNADLSKIDDPNGIDEDSATYAWYRDGSIIIGATEASYSVTKADVGASISLEISYRDMLGIEETFLSDESDPILGNGKSLLGSPASDFLIGGSGEDFIDGGAGDDTLLGRNGYDLLIGAAGQDQINGNGGSDILRGGSYRDRLVGGKGADTLFGGEGNDSLVAGQGNDLLFGGNGDDQLRSGAGEDTLWGMEGSDRLAGGHGNDVLYGGLGNDKLLGLDSFDKIWGDEGDDTLFGGSSNDMLYGGDGADQLFGEQQNDFLAGDDGNDLLDGGSGRDILNGDAGDDTLLGAGRRDILNGGDGDDELCGGSSGDRLYGDLGNDTLRGNGAQDRLEGGAGADVLDGGNGQDVLNGQAGNDIMTGGKGSDRFIFSTGSDTITDFDAISDLERIDMRAAVGIKDFNSMLSNANLVVDGLDVTITDKNGSAVVLQNINASDLDAGDFIF